MDNKKNGCCCGHEDEQELKGCACGDADEGDCCCGDMDDDIVTLVDENGDEHEFFTLATYDIDDVWYTVLEPVEQTEGFNEGDVIIFRLEEDEDGEDAFMPIEDEAELEKAFAEFKKMLEDDEQ